MYIWMTSTLCMMIVHRFPKREILCHRLNRSISFIFYRFFRVWEADLPFKVLYDTALRGQQHIEPRTYKLDVRDFGYIERG